MANCLSLSCMRSSLEASFIQCNSNQRGEDYKVRRLITLTSETAVPKRAETRVGR